jgi:alpha-tubulin suppressor-like RCC1 family protein
MPGVEIMRRKDLIMISCGFNHSLALTKNGQVLGGGIIRVDN